MPTIQSDLDDTNPAWIFVTPGSNWNNNRSDEFVQSWMKKENKNHTLFVPLVAMRLGIDTSYVYRTRFIILTQVLPLGIEIRVTG